MAIYDPENWLSKDDEELLLLLDALLESEEAEFSTNVPTDRIALDAGESGRLDQLLVELDQSERFQLAAYFAEGFTDPEVTDEGRLRELYLSQRRKRGRKRVASTHHWADFKARLGTFHGWSSYFRVGNRMSIDHFLRMEKRLFLHHSITPTMRRRALAQIQEHLDEVEKARSGEMQIPPGTILGIPKQLRKDLGRRLISKSKVTSLAVIVADCSALFTTRDWSVAGTLSCMAGAIASLRE